MVILLLLLLAGFGVCYAASHIYLAYFLKKNNMKINSLLKIFFPFVFANSNMILLCLFFEVVDIDCPEHREIVWSAFNVEFTFISYYVIPLLLIKSSLISKRQHYILIIFIAYLSLFNIVGKCLKWIIELSPNATFFDNYTFFNVYYSSNYLLEYLTFLGSLMTALFAGYGEIQNITSSLVYPFLSSQCNQIQLNYKQTIDEANEQFASKQKETDSLSSTQIEELNKLKSLITESEMQYNFWEDKASYSTKTSIVSKGISKIMGLYAVIHLLITFYFLFFSDYYDYSMIINKKQTNYIDNILVTTFSYFGSVSSSETASVNMTYKRVERYLSLGVVGLALISNVNSFLQYVIFISTQLLKKMKLTINENTQVILMSYCITLFYVVSSVFIIFTLPLAYRSKIKDMYVNVDFALLCYFYDKTYFISWICFGLFEIAIYLSKIKDVNARKPKQI